MSTADRLAQTNRLFPGSLRRAVTLLSGAAVCVSATACFNAHLGPSVTPTAVPTTAEEDERLSALLPGHWKHESTLHSDGHRKSHDDVWIIGRHGGLEWRNALGSNETWPCSWTREGHNLHVRYQTVNNFSGAPIDLKFIWRIEQIDDHSLTVFAYGSSAIETFSK